MDNGGGRSTGTDRIADSFYIRGNLDAELEARLSATDALKGEDDTLSYVLALTSLASVYLRQGAFDGAELLSEAVDTVNTISARKYDPALEEQMGCARRVAVTTGIHEALYYWLIDDTSKASFGLLELQNYTKRGPANIDLHCETFQLFSLFLSSRATLACPLPPP